jgi:PAS domain S-box-containing protein
MDELKIKIKELQEENYKLRTILDCSHDWEIFSDPNGRLIYVSPSFEKITGYTVKEIFDDQELIFKIVHPDDLETFKQHEKHLDKKSGSSFRFDFRILTKDNKAKWIRHACLPVNDSSGNYIGHRSTNQDITAEKTVRKNEVFLSEQLNALIQAIPHAIFAKDLNGRFTIVNKTFEKYFEKTAKEIIGKTIPEIWPEEENHFFYSIKDEELLKSEQIQFYERTFITSNQEKIETLIFKSLFKDEKGTPIGIVGGIMNVSKSKNAENALRKSEEKYRMLSEITTDAASSTIINKDGTLTREWTVDKILHEYGYTFDDIDTFDKWQKVVHPDDLAVFIEGKNKVIKGEKFSADIRIITKKGDIRWINDTFKPVLDPKTGILRLLSSVKDITELKKAEQNFWESEEKYRSLAENMDDIIGRIDMNLTIQYINKAIEQFHTLKSSEYLGKNINQLNLSPETVKFLSEYVSIVARTKKPVHTTIKHFRANKEVFFNCRFYPEFDENNNVKSVLGVCSDITELIKIEQELIRSKDKAEESDRLKSIFLANMSHEIRTPMNAIIGFTTLMNNDILPLDTRKKYLDIINSSANHLLSIINDILDISKIEAGQMELVENNFDLHKLLSDALEQFNIQKVQKKKEHIEIKLANNCSTPCFIFSDEIKIQQVFNNLLFNALKFIEKGYIVFGYNQITEQSRQMLCFYVKDTGIGIADDKKDVIFERFRQEEENINSKHGGTGLGLAISKGIIDMMNGKIWFESKKGEGTTFYFTIPFKKADQKDPKEVSSIPLSDFIFLNKTILVVDDTIEIHHYLSEVLVKTGAHLLHAMNAHDAILLIDSQPQIDVVLMDIRLPDINGMELTRLIKNKKNIPVIAQTALALSGDRQKVLDAGCDDYITKPIDRLQLLISISKFLVDKKPVW